MSAVIFEHVYKNYPTYNHVTGGLKNLLFNLPRAVREMRTQSFEALQDICFEIPHGHSVAIIGRNGAGKSTTLGLIAGVLLPTKGKVTVNGRVSPLLELGGGFHPDLTGRENIRLNGVLLGLSFQQIRSKIDEIIDFAGIEEFIDRPIRTYSSGMLARLGFSIVAHLEPEILLVDEILAVGDMAFQKKCNDRILKFKKEGITIILVSHSLNDVRTLCSHTIWIDQHRLRGSGDTETILSEFEIAMS